MDETTPRKILSTQPPCILDVDQLRPAGPPAVNFDHVEPVEIPGPTVPETPDLRHSTERLPLAPADRLTAAPEGLSLPSLHFNEGHESTATYHQVQFVAPHAEPVGLDPPTRVAKMEDGELLPRETETVAGIGPVIRRDGSGVGHGDSVRHTVAGAAPCQRRGAARKRGTA